MSKILVIQPEGEIDDGLIEAIHRAGLSTMVIDDYDTAIAAFTSQPSSLVVLDLALGGNRGLDLCRAIREIPFGSLVPVLMVGTGKEGIENIADALAEGGDYYFPKPIDPQKVVFKILTYVGTGAQGSVQARSDVEPDGPEPETPSPKGLAGRMEQLFDLGSAFQQGRKNPKKEPVLQTSTASKVSAEVGKEEETSEAVLARIAGELASMRAKEIADEEDDLEKETAAWGKIEQEVDDQANEPLNGSIEELARKEAEESAKKAAQEKARKQSEEKARREAEEKARREAEEKARREAEEKARREAEEKARKQAEEKARKQAEEKARKEAEERARKQAEEKARKEAEERARKQAEEKARKQAEEKARKEAEEKARKEAEEKARKEAEKRAQILEEEIEELEQLEDQFDDEMQFEDAYTSQIINDGKAADSNKNIDTSKDMDDEDGTQFEDDFLEMQETKVGPDKISLHQQVETKSGNPMKLVRFENGTKDSTRISNTAVFESSSSDEQFDHGSERNKPRLATVEEAGLVFRPPEPAMSNLGNESVPRIFWRMYVQEVTGQITFQSKGLVKEVFFEAGVPVGVRSKQTSDRLEEMLFRQGLIDRAAYAEAKIKNVVQPRRLATHLVERGILRADELFPLVRRHLEDCMIGLFEWTEGTVGYQPKRVPDSEKVRLSRPVTWLVMEGIRRKFILERLMRDLGSPSSLLVGVPAQDRSNKIPELSDIGFVGDELQIVELVDGLRPIEEIVFLSGQGPIAVYQALMGGEVIGLLAVAVKGVPSDAEEPIHSMQRELEISRRRIEAKYEQVSKSSYFDIMGVSREATQYEIETAFKRLSREFHPVRLAHQELSDLDAKLKDIRQALEEAYEVLSDEHLRERYRQSLS